MARPVQRRGLFYNRFTKSGKGAGEAGTETDINLRQQLVYHKLGTPQVGADLLRRHLLSVCTQTLRTTCFGANATVGPAAAGSPVPTEQH